MRLRDAAAVVALWLLAASGCQGQSTPRDQWKVYVGTDALVPALGQQLFVELVDSMGNVSASRTRIVDASRPELWPISFGVLPPEGNPSGAALRLRVRLYRIEATSADGSPAGTEMLDALADLPPLTGGETTVALPLSMACFGEPADVSTHSTCDAVTGKPTAEPTLVAGADPSMLPTVGTWPPGASVPCPSSPPQGMICIPGGVFLIGATRFFQLGSGADPTPERLVKLSPFALDAAEMTVAQARALVAQGLPAPATADGEQPNECQYTAAPGMNDGQPVNCITWSQANQACSMLHKRLPREAEWEYAAGNLGLKTPYPWGTANDINDVCTTAIVARGREGLDPSSECLQLQNNYAPGPLAGGSALDSTLLHVANMAGNVSEWTADIFAPYDGPCWTGASHLLVNPVCTTAIAGASQTAHSIRGGTWQDDAVFAQVFLRNVSLADGPAVAVGLRCAVGM